MASPTSLPEPGGSVTFSIKVRNTSPADTVTVSSLTDSIYGDLFARGDCDALENIQLAPADGSAGVSTRQAPYAGSARQARGAVMRALHDGPRPAAAFDADIVAGLVADRLVTRVGDAVELP